MEKLRLGVLGTSGLYKNSVSPALRSSSLVTPYAIASRDKGKAQKYAEACNFAVTYDSYEALLADKKVDFVYIPLPNHLHVEYIKKAADAGKPVLCEKPVALNAASAAEAATYCEKKGVPVMEAFMYRLHPQWRKVKEFVTCGEIGAIHTVHTAFSYMNVDPQNIRNIASIGGGALYDIGCYAVSSSRFIMGTEPERAVVTITRDANFKTDVLVAGMLDFGGGKMATFSVSTQSNPYQRVTTIGSTGVITVEIPFNMPGDRSAHIEVRTGGDTRVIETAPTNQYLSEFDEFARAVIDKTEVPTPFSDAVANMAVLDALFASGESGTWETVKRW
jgi:predicted dehydrogenase